MSHEKTTKRQRDPHIPPTDPSRKRQRTSVALKATNFANTRTRSGDFESAERPGKRKRPKPTICPEEVGDKSRQRYISHWAASGGDWPEEFKMDTKIKPLLAKKKSKILRRKRSGAFDALSTTSTDQTFQEEKSSAYNNPSYPELLRSAGIFLEDHPLGMSKAGKKLCDRLLHTLQDPPENTLFNDDTFNRTMRNIRGRNEATIIERISHLLVPSPETLALFGNTALDYVVESTNEGWNDCFPITNPRPQPDKAFGLLKSLFSEEHIQKLEYLLGPPGWQSLFKGTFNMVFPFFAKEAKGGPVGLFAADNQTAHSMGVAVRGLVELYKFSGRQKELHQEPLSFSVSHDDSSVRIHTYYPMIDEADMTKNTTWRATLDEFYVKPKSKWSSWTFGMNCLQIFLPMHIERIRSALDDLPSAEIIKNSLPRPPGHSGLSQNFEEQSLSSDQADLETPQNELQQVTPESSNLAGPDPKKHRRGRPTRQSAKN